MSQSQGRDCSPEGVYSEAWQCSTTMPAAHLRDGGNAGSHDDCHQESLLEALLVRGAAICEDSHTLSCQHVYVPILRACICTLFKLYALANGNKQCKTQPYYEQSRIQPMCAWQAEHPVLVSKKPLAALVLRFRQAASR